ncbi:MAG: hypothetical protein M9907_17415 [Burkholderiaceae bacterium]|nr:hypothetical protein [Burkholderiaceae bacterium]
MGIASIPSPPGYLIRFVPGFRRPSIAFPLSLVRPGGCRSRSAPCPVDLDHSRGFLARLEAVLVDPEEEQRVTGFGRAARIAVTMHGQVRLADWV